MTRNLDLRVTDYDDGIAVQWNDFERAKKQPLLGLIGGIVLTFVAALLIDTSNPAAAFLGATIAGIFVGWIPGMVLYGIIKIAVEKPTPKQVIFTTEMVEAGGQTCNINEVSRIEYSKRGVWDRSDLDAVEDTVIRIWVGDSHYLTASTNNWTTAINHQIRDALARALDEVRKGKAKEVKAEKFGDQGDLGMPDY